MKKLVLVGALVLGIVFLLGVSAIVVWGGARALLRNGTEAVALHHGPACESGEHAAVAQRGGRRQSHGSSGEHAPQSGSADQNQQRDSDERGYPNAGEVVTDRLVVEGTVTLGTASGEDIVVQSTEGAEVLVGTGPQWLQLQGFVLEPGDPVRISGYWEDGEFKAAQITRLSDGASIELRDADGRPAWAGSGQRSQSESERGGNASQGNGRNQK